MQSAQGTACWMLDMFSIQWKKICRMAVFFATIPTCSLLLLFCYPYTILSKITFVAKWSFKCACIQVKQMSEFWVITLHLDLTHGGKSLVTLERPSHLLLLCQNSCDFHWACHMFELISWGPHGAAKFQVPERNSLMPMQTPPMRGEGLGLVSPDPLPSKMGSRHKNIVWTPKYYQALSSCMLR